jgi:hypothetical protein
MGKPFTSGKRTVSCFRILDQRTSVIIDGVGYTKFARRNPRAEKIIVSFFLATNEKNPYTSLTVPWYEFFTMMLVKRNRLETVACNHHTRELHQVIFFRNLGPGIKTTKD